MQLQDVLYSQGFGTRRVCAGLIQHGLVAIDGEVVLDAALNVQTQGLRFTVQGQPWDYHERAYVMLHGVDLFSLSKVTVGDRALA